MNYKNDEFFDWFEQVIPKLGIRKHSFKKIFNYLDTLPDPIIIVETGCLRIKDNFGGDGQSTLLFDKYSQLRGKGSKVFTVDIDPKATKVCSEIVSENVSIETCDSVKYLNDLSQKFYKDKTNVSLFYLDSFDVDWRFPSASCEHHLKELTSIKKILSSDSLVVVDDSPLIGYMQQNPKELSKFELIPTGPVPPVTISGKGSLINEYAIQTGAKLLFSHYQTGWIGFN